jgi:hypothetical protein
VHVGLLGRRWKRRISNIQQEMSNFQVNGNGNGNDNDNDNGNGNGNGNVNNKGNVSGLMFFGAFNNANQNSV